MCSGVDKVPRTKAVLLDLHGTLAFISRKVDPLTVSTLLISRGHSIYPQTWAAALQFVSMVDYPKHGYGSFRALMAQTMHRLGAESGAATLDELTREYEKEKWELFHDSESCLRALKDKGMLTAIVTTIPQWRFGGYIAQLRPMLDMVVDGNTFGVEKSDPRIYIKTLESLGVQASEALMVGDDELTDVTVPKSISMGALLLRRKGKESGSGDISSLDEIVSKIA